MINNGVVHLFSRSILANLNQQYKEIVIQEAMDRLKADRTSFIIADRLSTIKNADLIIVMEKGGIVESGHKKNYYNKKVFMHNCIKVNLNFL